MRSSAALQASVGSVGAGRARAAAILASAAADAFLDACSVARAALDALSPAAFHSSTWALTFRIVPWSWPIERFAVARRLLRLWFDHARRAITVRSTARPIPAMV